MNIKKEKINEIKNINDSKLLNDFIKESKELFNDLIPLKKENKYSIFKYLSYVQFGLYILPYLSFKDILLLRKVSKEMNLLINSNIYCLNYYIKILKNLISFNDNINISSKTKNSSTQLKPFEELNEESEFLAQKSILNNIKSYIKSPGFSLNQLTKLYKVEMDYLKYEEKHQIRYMKSMIEIQNKINNEYQLIIKKEKNEDININNSRDKVDEINNLDIDDLKNKIEELKIKKENILFKLNREKKLNEDIINKNKENNGILTKFQNLFFDNNNIDNINE